MTPRRKLRMTRQRQSILEEVRRMNSHPAADEVYETVRRRMPRISLGTVYRNLEILSENGLIEKMGFGGSQRRFDGNLETHYHARCTRCGRVEDVPIEPVTDLEDTIGSVCNYEITGHRLEFVGLCPECGKGKANFRKGNKKMAGKEK